MNRASVVAIGRGAMLSLCLCFGLALAQAPEPAHAAAPEEVDPPGRAARLSYIQGEVSLQPAGEEEWASAYVNRPLTTGDKLWTDEGARAEIYVGPAAVRLGSDTGFSFLNVDDDTIQMRMTAGVMDVRVRDLDENDHVEIDTPNVALSILRPGKYRVEVNDEGDTTVVKVSEGEAEAFAGSTDMAVRAQQSATFRGMEEVTAQIGTLGAPDEFDSWSLERDRRDQVAATSESVKYVSPEVTGYEDLDANGTWVSEPEYGYVWAPRVVAVDWAPYRYGRWVWVRPWGWTWVDDAPWGYAPFHYGRWAHIRNRWCWVPGPRHIRPVYAPALVGWVGSPGVSVTVGVGSRVAWFPLGPREVYVPARRYSPRYVERVNVSNTVIVNRTYITNVYNNRVTNVEYRNRRVPGGVTAVSRTTFVSARPVGRHQERIDARQFARARATPVAPQIQPERRSVLGVSDDARRNVRRPPEQLQNRQVIARRAPPPSASRLVRTPTQSTFAREQADRLHRMQQGRELNAGDQPARTRTPGRPTLDTQRSERDRTAREQASREQVASREQSGREQAAREQSAREQATREQAARDAAAAARGSRDDRPSSAQARAERPLRNERDIPNRINRGARPDDLGSADREAQIQRRLQEQQALNERRAQDQRAQLDRQSDAQRAQLDRQAEEQRARLQRQADDQRRDQLQRQADDQRRAQLERQAQNENERRANDERRAALQRQMEEQRAQSERRMQDAQRAQTERQADEQRRAIERQASEQRRAQEEQRAQMQRQMAEQRAQSERRMQEAQRAQMERQASEQRRAQEQQRAQMQRQMEAQRQERARVAERPEQSRPQRPQQDQPRPQPRGNRGERANRQF